MGYEARFELEDARGRRWRGVHSAAGRALPDIIQPLLAEGGLADGLAPALERLPASARLTTWLGANVAGLEVDGPSPLRVALKWVGPVSKGAVDAVLHLHEGSRARRAYLLAHRLRAFGLPTPRPLAYLERAMAAGYDNRDGLMGDPDLVLLREDPRFAELAAELVRLPES